MTRKLMGLIGLGATVLVAGCAAKAPPYNPFRVARDQFYPKLKIVALAPMAVPRDFDDPDPAVKSFTEMIEAQLGSAGFAIVPADSGRTVWDSLTAQIGGYFDPVTGEIDEAKLKAVRTHMYRELRARHNIDAMLFSSLAVVQARLQSDQASWDGTSQNAGKGKFWKALLGMSHSGTIPALSLHVILADTEDTDLYINAGGIELLAKVGVGGVVPVSRAELFRDQERNVRAVHIALDPLLGRTAPK